MEKIKTVQIAKNGFLCIVDGELYYHYIDARGSHSVVKGERIPRDKELGWEINSSNLCLFFSDKMISILFSS